MIRRHLRRFWDWCRHNRSDTSLTTDMDAARAIGVREQRAAWRGVKTARAHLHTIRDNPVEAIYLGARKGPDR